MAERVSAIFLVLECSDDFYIYEKTKFSELTFSTCFNILLPVEVRSRPESRPLIGREQTMARNKLTDKFVRSSLAPGRYSDGAGLFLRVRESGHKGFVVLVNVSGKRREVTIGPYGTRAGEFSLAAAREQADEVQRRAKAGESLTASRPSLEAADKGATPIPSFGQFALDVLSDIETEFRNPKHRAQWRSTLTTYCANFWDRQIDQITTDDVFAVLKPIWLTKSETASRVRGRVERILSAAKVKGYRSGENPAAWHGHLEELLPRRKSSAVKHHPAMPYTELPNFWRKLSTINTTPSFALRFLITTATRSSEVRLATWGEFDLEKKIWTVPGERMKAGRDHRIPLSDTASEIVRIMATRSISEYVFPGSRENRPLSDATLSKFLHAHAERCVPHGFRSTFRDWVGEETEFPREIAEAALAHIVGDATERAYRRGDALERRRQLMAAWAAFVTGTPLPG